MKSDSISERLLVEELRKSSSKTQLATKGLPIGALIKIIRQQLGMSQQILAKRANVPQSTVSRVERGGADLSLSTLNKILNALSCDLLIAPLLRESTDCIRRKRAKEIAERRVHYLKGTMNLEDQQPDPQFVEELLKQEEERLLKGSGIRLWGEND